MKVAQFFGLVLSFVIAPLANARSGDTRGNGGDSIFCATQPGAKFTGAYVLDFVARASTDEYGLHALGSGPFSIDYAQQIFRERGMTELADELGNFLDTSLNQIFDRPCESCKYVWRKSTLGLVDVKDDVLFTKLPSNCYQRGKKSIRLKQLVVRQTMPGSPGIIFDYDPAEFTKISDRPFQRSFLLMHEWLWQHADNADAIRNLNWYLHSKKLDTDKDIDILHSLANLGFKFRSKSRPANVSSKLRFSNAIDLRYSGRNEPNGMKAFHAPQFLVIDPTSTVIKFKAPGPELFNVFAQDESGNRTEFCQRSKQCEIKISKSWGFPLRLIIERENMRDPIWDIKFVYLFR